MAKGLKLIRRMDGAGLIRWHQPKVRSRPRFTRWTFTRIRLRNLWYRLKCRFRPDPRPEAYMTCETLMVTNPKTHQMWSNFLA